MAMYECNLAGNRMFFPRAAVALPPLASPIEDNLAGFVTHQLRKLWTCSLEVVERCLWTLKEVLLVLRY